MKYTLYLLVGILLAGCSCTSKSSYELEMAKCRDSLKVYQYEKAYSASASMCAWYLGYANETWMKMDSLTYEETKRVLGKSQSSLIDDEYSCWLSLSDSLVCFKTGICCADNFDDPYRHVMGYESIWEIDSLHINMYIKDMEISPALTTGRPGGVSELTDTMGIYDIELLSRTLIYTCKGMYYDVSSRVLSEELHNDPYAEDFYYHRQHAKELLVSLPDVLSRWITARQHLEDSFSDDPVKRALIRKNTAVFLQELINAITYQW